MKAGDRVRVVGIYRALGATTGSISSTASRTILIANNIMTRHHLTSFQLSQKEKGLVTDLVKQLPPQTLLKLLSRSIAPFIYGHEEIKKGILMMLLGGEEKTLENATHLRGFDSFV